MDVAATEPIPPDSPLLRAPNCIITPHVAWVPKETRQRLLDFAVENLRCYLAAADQRHRRAGQAVKTIKQEAAHFLF